MTDNSIRTKWLDPHVTVGWDETEPRCDRCASARLVVAQRGRVICRKFARSIPWGAAANCDDFERVGDD